MEGALLIVIIANVSEVCIYMCQYKIQVLKLEIKALVAVCHQHDKLTFSWNVIQKKSVTISIHIMA